MALLTCNDVSFAYEGTPVLTDVTFSVNSGDYLCIIGENGSGKSTRFRTSMITARIPFTRRIWHAIR